ncbi:MAG: hypothetical protein ACO23R_02660 [bacterium]
MSVIYLVRNDNNSQLKVTLTREDTGAQIDLRTATVRLKIKRKGTNAVLLTLTALEISDLENGEAIFNFDSTALAISAGEYLGEVETTFASGTIETTYDELSFLVRDDY